MSSTSGADFWSRFSHDPRRPEHAQLRAGDAERALVLDVLGDAFADGRLTHEEYDERAEQAAAARRLGELPPLLADLVRATGVAVVPADLQQRAVQKFERDRREALWGFLSTSAVCWVIWFAVMPGGFPWPAIVMAVTGLNALRIQFLRASIINEHRRKLEWKARKELGRRPPASRPDRGELNS